MAGGVAAGRPACPFGWFPDWRGRSCVIVGSGPSAGCADLGRARGVGVIAINEGWRLAPWADVLYACDRAWWLHRQGVPDFEGLKVTADARAASEFGLRRVRVDDVNALQLRSAGVLGSGGNSGFQAVNLAVQFGVQRIVLVGFDLNMDGGVHWHGLHPGRLNNPTSALLAQWAARLDAQAPLLARLGVEVLNASPTSALAAFPKVPLEEAITC